MNRRERRKAAAEARHALTRESAAASRHESRKEAARQARREAAAREGLTGERALEAIWAALSPELRAEIDADADPEAMGGLARIADCVVQGLCTVAEAVEAIGYTNELADATVRGDISRDVGDVLVDKFTARQRGEVDAD